MFSQVISKPLLESSSFNKSGLTQYLKPFSIKNLVRVSFQVEMLPVFPLLF